MGEEYAAGAREPRENTSGETGNKHSKKVSVREDYRVLPKKRKKFCPQ